MSTVRAGPRQVLAVAVLCGGLAAARGAAAYDVGSAPYLGGFGVAPLNPPGLLGSLTVENAVHDASGSVYVVETMRVSKFDRDGNLLLTWPCDSCYGIDVNQATGDVYVVQQPLNAITQFSSTGKVVRVFGSAGGGPGELNQPHGIGVDPATGNVFVWDTGNARVQVFDGQGAYLRQFGQKGKGADEFSGVAGPGGLAFDAIHRWVYVTDPITHRVMKFGEDGKFLKKWGDPPGGMPGHFHWPRSVEVDGAGNVYVADTDSERIQFFTSDGAYLGQFQGPQNVAQGPFHPRDIAINRITGAKYVNASYAFREDEFDAKNAYLRSWGGKFSDGASLDQPMGLAVDPTNGDVVLVDGGAFLFKRFTRGGAFERSWGFSYRVDITRAGGVGQGNHTAVAVAPDGSVWTGIVGTYYADNPAVPWITHFDPDGAVIGAAKRKPVAGNYGEIIAAVAVEPESRDLFVSDLSFNHLRRVNALGIPVKELALPLPGGLSLAGGKLYVVSAQGETVKRFDGKLALEETFGSPGTGDGQFDFDPQSGIAARASDGHVFVADTRNNRVQELGADGGFVAKRGSYGSDPGQFALPEDVALSPAGDVLYVANTYDHRIDMFCLSADAACNAIVDQDGDGLGDFQDNCPFEKNPRQRDGGSFASKVPDGIGDACQCGDLSGDGVVDAADVAAYREFLTRNPSDPSPAARKCKIAPGGGPCSILDVVVLERALDPRHLLGPQVSQLCEAATKVAP